MGKRVSLVKVSEIPEGSVKSFQVEEVAIAVFHRAEGFFAIEDRCTHAEVRLSDGWVEGGCVSCPWHGAQFDLRTGEALSLPATEAVRTFPVTVEDGEVAIEL